jgi:hypothetical protein
MSTVASNRIRAPEQKSTTKGPLLCEHQHQMAQKGLMNVREL